MKDHLERESHIFQVSPNIMKIIASNTLNPGQVTQRYLRIARNIFLILCQPHFP